VSVIATLVSDKPSVNCLEAKKIKTGNLVDFYPGDIEELVIDSSDNPYNFTTINFRYGGKPIKTNYSELRGHLISKNLGLPREKELNKICRLIELIYKNKEYL